MKRTRNVISLLLVVFFAFSAGYFVSGQSSSAPVQAQDQGQDEVFAPFWEAYDVLNARYVDPLDPETLMLGALNGMMDAVGDPNTNYLDAEAYEGWQLSLSGEFEGIGATVRQDEDNGALTIVAPLEDSPAERAGLQPGDQIVEVGGEDITELSQSEIVSRVRGPAGTPVRLTILRPGSEDEDVEDEVFELTIIRARLELPDVEYEVLEGEIGYVRLHQFSDQTAQRLQDALTTLDADHLQGLVLDLRNNPGGYLSTSLQVISQFVEGGPILIEQLPGGDERVHEAFGSPLAPNVPMAVLVNEGSASASELVAGALHDRERAIIVGEPTFGKNTVQTIHELNAGGAVRVTIARWVTPDGISSEPDGIFPDVEIANDPDAAAEDDAQLSAALRALKGMFREQLRLPAELG